MPTTCTAFLYKDSLTGKVLVCPGRGGLEKPHSPVFGEVYKDTHVAFIDQMVERARTGNLVSKVDALLTLSHFLERKWPIPDSLAGYIANAVEDAVISFGHTEGTTREKHTAICTALGLTLSRGRSRTGDGILKQGIVHSYIWWRMELFNQTLYEAAKCAENAFRGTLGMSHDHCEKIFNAYESKLDIARRFSPSFLHFVELKLYPDEYRAVAAELYFDDDDFLCALAPRILKGIHPDDELSDEIVQFLNKIGVPIPQDRLSQ